MQKEGEKDAAVLSKVHHGAIQKQKATRQTNTQTKEPPAHSKFKFLIHREKYFCNSQFEILGENGLAAVFPGWRQFFQNFGPPGARTPALPAFQGNP